MSPALREKIRHEAQSFAVIFVYIWAILALFALYKSFLLGKNPFAGQVLAIINAFVLGKVIVALEFFRAGRFLEIHRGIFRILGKSVLFGLVLLVFRLVEEEVRGWFRGRNLGQSFAEIDSAKLTEMATLAIIICVTLIPYFFLREILTHVGMEKLRKILLDRPAPP